MVRCHFEPGRYLTVRYSVGMFGRIALCIVQDAVDHLVARTVPKWKIWDRNSEQARITVLTSKIDLADWDSDKGSRQVNWNGKNGVICSAAQAIRSSIHQAELASRCDPRTATIRNRHAGDRHYKSGEGFECSLQAGCLPACMPSRHLIRSLKTSDILCVTLTARLLDKSGSLLTIRGATVSNSSHTTQKSRSVSCRH